MPRIDAIRFGLAGGTITALMCFLLTLLATINGYGIDFLNVLRGVFLGFEISVFGSVIGAIYGFMIGFIKLFSIAFIYNLLGPAKDL
jgi:hypothetical protein